MKYHQSRIGITNRDQRIFEVLFENRVMSANQIARDVFPKISQQTVSRRLTKLFKFGFLERISFANSRGKYVSLFSNSDKSINVLKRSYKSEITSEIVKSDSIAHDLDLVDIRSVIQKKKSVATYLSENVLQSCKEYSETEQFGPFVRKNTDAVVEIVKNGSRITVGLEYEKSEKALDRYTKKLLAYYADPNTLVILFICSNERIIRQIASAESEIGKSERPRCFFALAENVLSENELCTFKNQKGDAITVI